MWYYTYVSGTSVKTLHERKLSKSFNDGKPETISVQLNLSQQTWPKAKNMLRLLFIGTQTQTLSTDAQPCPATPCRHNVTWLQTSLLRLHHSTCQSTNITFWVTLTWYANRETQDATISDVESEATLTSNARSSASVYATVWLICWMSDPRARLSSPDMSTQLLDRYSYGKLKLSVLLWLAGTSLISTYQVL